MRKQAHPGRILKNMYIKPLNLTIAETADMLDISEKTLRNIINEQESVTIELASKLASYFNTTPDLWLNLQKNYDNQ